MDIGVELEAAAAALPEEHVLALARIFQEAASNSVRHGGARFIQVELRRGGRSAPLLHRGRPARGFDAKALAETGYETLRTTGHRGLANIDERVRLFARVDASRALMHSRRGKTQNRERGAASRSFSQLPRCPEGIRPFSGQASS